MGRDSASESTASSIEDLVTVITITHYERSNSHGDLSPPSSGLVQETVRSLRSKLPGIDRASHELYYNHPSPDSTGKAADYGANLSDVCADLDLNYHRHPNRGMKATLSDAVGRVDTPYTLFLEHDWKFIESISLPDVIHTLESHDDVNYIRFNKRQNEAIAWDTIVREDLATPVPLCKVSTFSNNPHITRTDQLREWIQSSTPAPRYLAAELARDGSVGGFTARQIAREFWLKYIERQPHVGIFDGMERVLDTLYKRDIRRQGFDAAWQKWGLALYGPKGGGPYVEHMGREVRSE